MLRTICCTMCLRLKTTLPRLVNVPRISGPQNKELERTRSTQTAVGPRRSIQCWTGDRVAIRTAIIIERSDRWVGAEHSS